MKKSTERLLMLGVVLYFLNKAANAVAAISREVQKFKNLGLTDEEDEKAQRTIADPKASTPDKMAAIAKLRTKVETGEQMGPVGVARLRPLKKALSLYERELQAQEGLKEKRAKWEADMKAKKAAATPLKSVPKPAAASS